MTNAWIPLPVAAVVALGYLAILAVHAEHLVRLRGRHRGWHAVHVLMASGMAAMFAPVDGGMLVPAGVGTWVFAGATLALLATLAGLALTGRRVGALWVVVALDLAAMTVMFAMADAPGPVALGAGVAGAVWSLLQALGWASGRFGRLLEHGGLGDAVVPAVPGRDAPAPGAGPAPAAGPGPAPGGGVRTAVRARRLAPRVADGGVRDWAVRASLTLMSVGMAYMLLAMAFAPAAAPGMPGMSGM